MTATSASPVDWTTQLRPWLDVFSSGGVSFGLVKDCRSDGSTFMRKGVVVRLCVDLLTVHQGDVALLEKIREAIDLVQLAVAVQPIVIKSVLTPETKSIWKNTTAFAAELAAMKRRVPVELRLEFSVAGIDISQLTPQFLDVMMQRLDTTLSTNTNFLTFRKQLQKQLLQHPELLKGVALGALSSAVRAKLIIDSAANENVSEAECESFFGNVVLFITALDQYQRREKALNWQIDTKHKAFRMKRIELRLRTVRLTSRVAVFGEARMQSWIPLALCQVSLDFRFISCSEAELNTFVQAITTVVETGSIRYLDDEDDERGSARRCRSARRRSS